MSRSVIYPKADTKAQWWGGNSTMDGITKLLLHTTETGTWPGYGGGGSAPTLTYHPVEHRWRQHMPLNASARALRDPSGTVVRENRDDLVQVEIICSCDRSFSNRHGYPHVTELDRQAINDLGDFAAFLHDEWGLPLDKAPIWLPYPESYGNSRARMTGSQYDRFRGICGHQHASGNTHGDPGDIDIDAILASAGRNTTTSREDEDDMPSAKEVADEWGKQPLNLHNPQGRAETRDVTRDEVMTAMALFLDDQPETRKYIDRARESRAPK